MKVVKPFTTLALSLFCTIALAQATGSGKGEVRRVDAQAGKITIKQEALSDLNLPAMTLVYKISPSLLNGIKAGDSVHFTVLQKDKQYTITEISK